MKHKANTVIFTLSAIVALTLFSVVASGQPTGPSSIDRGPSETAATVGGVAQEAEGGNITPLFVQATAQSNRWQGYFGNVSGDIVLDDANANTLYRWDNANPQGEIYAVNGSVTPVWTNVTCLNLSNTNTPLRVSVSEIEATLGISTNDAQGVNETFNMSFSGSFGVGSSVTIDSTSGCGAVSLNVNDVGDSLNFNQTILTDNTTEENVIYVALLEQDQAGFRTSGEPSDFQMIVGENGDAAGPSTYYFYVELS